jgi:choloylglycine hydrolase
MKIILFILICCLSGFASLACTTFCLSKNGQLAFGRNYDWVTGAGIVHSNQRGLLKTSYPNEDGSTIQWVSLYGSITFNQYGKEFPTGGMNEKGLVVELMWLDDTKYPAKDSRPAVDVLQWIQYQLDNAATVDELIATDKKIRISDGTPLHYLVADASGNVASIEFLHGKMIIHKSQNLPFPVLANSTYQESAQTAKRYINNADDLSNLDNSLERYVKACRMVKKVSDIPANMQLTDYAFSILDKVSQGDYTKWSIVYDISGKKILFKTQSHKSIKSISLNEFDFNCNKTPRMYNMNQQSNGNITSNFTEKDDKLERTILEKAVKESQSQVNISNNTKEAILRYDESVRCK